MRASGLARMSWAVPGPELCRVCTMVSDQVLQVVCWQVDPPEAASRVREAQIHRLHPRLEADGGCPMKGCRCQGEAESFKNLFYFIIIL